MAGRIRVAIRALVLVGLTAAAVSVAGGHAGAAEPAFGTAPVVSPPPAGPPATISAVEVGRHAGFDRVVFRVGGPSLGYDVRYTSQLVEDASGRVLPLAGSAVLTVTLRQTTWTDAPSPRVNRSDAFPALRQVRSAGEFEAVASYGLGQAGRDGFRVFRLAGPDRVVVDLRHPAGTAPPSGSPAVPSAGTSPARTGTGAGAGTGTGVGASPAPPSEPDVSPSGAAEPVGDTDDGFPLPAVLIGVLVAGLLAAGGIALRAR